MTNSQGAPRQAAGSEPTCKHNRRKEGVCIDCGVNAGYHDFASAVPESEPTYGVWHQRCPKCGENRLSPNVDPSELYCDECGHHVTVARYVPASGEREGEGTRLIQAALAAWRQMRATPGTDDTGSTRLWTRNYMRAERLLDRAAGIDGASSTPPVDAPADGETRLEAIRPGVWDCPKCGFTQVTTILNPTTGATGAQTVRDADSLVCPNDGSPLRAATWKAHALELRRMIDDLDAQLAALRADREDAERLDWIEANAADCLCWDVPVIEGEALTSNNGWTVERLGDETDDPPRGKTLRDAVDWAMKCARGLPAARRSQGAIGGTDV